MRTLSSLALLLAGCAGSDLKSVCDVATEYSTKPIDPAQKAAAMAQAIDERVSRFGDTRKIFSAIANVAPEQRYAVLRQGAKEMGHPEWTCPALEAMWKPEAPKAETGFAGKVCAPWAGAASLVARTQAGRGDFFRELRYDFRSGVLAVSDSDPFATGQEAKEPRVVEKTRTLVGQERARVEFGVIAVCPGEEALKAACAPGGCSRLEVKNGSGLVKIEDGPTVQAVTKVLTPFFPELRAQ